MSEVGGDKPSLARTGQILGRGSLLQLLVGGGLAWAARDGKMGGIGNKGEEEVDRKGSRRGEARCTWQLASASGRKERTEQRH